MDRFKRPSGVQGWWFGAPLIGVLFGMVANKFFPEVVNSIAVLIYRVSGNGPAPSTISADATRFLSALVGMVLAVIALAAWRLGKHLTRVA